jgi:hypothetical protein
LESMNQTVYFMGRSINYRDIFHNLILLCTPRSL